MNDLLLMRKRPLVFDGFNRADSVLALGNADTGQLWAADSGVFGIAQKLAYKVSGTSYDAAYITVNQRAYKVSVDLATMGEVAGRKYLFCRYVSNSSFVGLGLTDGTYRLEKRVSATFTVLAEIAIVPKDGDILSISQDADGKMMAYINGTLAATVTDAALLGDDNKVGVGGYGFSSSRFDNFSVEV